MKSWEEERYKAMEQSHRSISDEEFADMQQPYDREGRKNELFDRVYAAKQRKDKEDADRIKGQEQADEEERYQREKFADRQRVKGW